MSSDHKKTTLRFSIMNERWMHLQVGFHISKLPKMLISPFWLSTNNTFCLLLIYPSLFLSPSTRGVGRCWGDKAFGGGGTSYCLWTMVCPPPHALFAYNLPKPLPSTHSLSLSLFVPHYAHLLPTPPLTLTLFNILNSSLSHSLSFSSCTSLCLLTPHPGPPHPYISHTVQHIVVSIWLSGSLTPFSLLASIGLMVICQKDLDMIRSISSIFSAWPCLMAVGSISSADISCGWRRRNREVD